MAPMTRPSASRSAEALRLVGMTSPLAVRVQLDVADRAFSTTSRRAAVNWRVSSALMKRETDCSTTSSVCGNREAGRNRIVGEGDLAFEVGDEHRVRSVFNKAGGEGAHLVRSSRMSRRMPMAPITWPSGSRRPRR